ncbi:MAG: N-acetyltransferase [Oscillospiraceae bacterium]|nr:N-acetyltransferase [Oscillospiraceae bacterium]
MIKDLVIRVETQRDYRTVEELTREAFWNVYRPGCLEHYVLHCFRSREEFIPELSLVLEKNGEIIGHIMYANARIDLQSGEQMPVMTFGPFSIAPQHQRKGYGAFLLEFSIEKAKKLGAEAVAITGNIDLYGKFGFEIAKTKGIVYKEYPDADFFLIKELKNGILDNVCGSYTDPGGYFVNEAEAEEFDKTFAPKQKLILPEQLG